VLFIIEAKSLNRSKESFSWKSTQNFIVKANPGDFLNRKKQIEKSWLFIFLVFTRPPWYFLSLI